ncbi:UDP-N-acetylmuramoyl-L-alanyl-D-glutamate--2,6-diaminopimelate ligase [Lysinibacter cavernae]|uniref:UDP-N-acetylmuramyl-tripeptide synthetase n=1 Tax=Lysinibacter cavernae TaxID=1640652 RepID=A0A7X5TT74_9MICO|nr:UDP-N-acetylmuramoyl-L-alanyl-D-glutamate--2,6-diaminopimelate ligase [Lysinibacter cavernae]NIH53003.1 UDP-N-acetylmuramoyl-L-alanyl-D-glutamate--2,6-diaminopimelate ligase [Lysinibacter cavernae]
MRSEPDRNLSLGDYDPRLAGTQILGFRLVQNSRNVQPGDIFVALGSTGADGSAFIDHAMNQGASAALYDPALFAASGSGNELPETAYAIRDLRAQLGRIADDFYGHPSEDLTMVGVTGTNGKTSVVQLISQAWNALDVPSASIGTLGAGPYGAIDVQTGLTTPPVTQVHELLASFKTQGVDAVAIEVSSHALEQGRVAGAHFDIAVFTNLTRDHLDYHLTMERYAAEKAKIFTLDGVSTAVINLDDPYGRNYFTGVASVLRRIGVSSHGHADATIRTNDVRLTPDGIECTLEIDGLTYPFVSGLIGRFNIDNLLACAGVLFAQGIDPAVIVETLSALKPVFGRMNRIQPDPSLPLVIVDYAHTPDALEQSLTALREHSHGRIITIFGCTGDRDRGKRPEMARIAEALSDVVIVTDDDVHHEDGDLILDDIRPGFERPGDVLEQRDRGLAIAEGISRAEAGDIVLIAGKGHESAMVVGDDLVSFSDTETATRLLGERLAGG